ncbi:MAG: hypothetical protein UU47_C0018G0010 [candidate division TM6 bacterium GW2011_GWE2_41_16]|nr:MAG: hypothetical protein UU47_C0018G0010 [candidate division TM6 bacterium GW2011_GWE2_41_16]
MLIFYVSFSLALNPGLADYFKFKDNFCSAAATVKYMRDQQKKDPLYRPSPVIDAIIEQGGSGTVRLCNVFRLAGDLAKFLDFSEPGNLLEIGNKLNIAGLCMKNAQDKKQRDMCFADSMLYVHQLIQPFFTAFIGEVRNNTFYEGSLLHVAHIEEFLPRSILENNPNLAEKIKSMTEMRDGMVEPFIYTNILPMLDLIRQMGLSLKSMSEKLTDQERASLTEIPGLVLSDESSESLTQPDPKASQDLDLSFE